MTSHEINDLLYGQIRGIYHDGVVGCSQRRRLASRIDLVSPSHLGGQLIEGIGCETEVAGASPGAFFRCSGEINLERRIVEDHRADITAFYDAGAGGCNPRSLFGHELCPDVWHGRNRGYIGRNRFAPELSCHILSVQCCDASLHPDICRLDHRSNFDWIGRIDL